MQADTFTFQQAETIEEAVFQALGAASTCWDNMEGTGVFHSERAKAIGDALMAFIFERQPMLGFATTEELLREITARVSVSDTIGEPIRLDYRTVDS